MFDNASTESVKNWSTVNLRVAEITEMTEMLEELAERAVRLRIFNSMAS